EGPRPRPPRPHPQLCTMQYEPVCARRGGDRQTFANACQAERAGYRIVREGPCRDGGGGGGEQTFCTREYAPVCARRYGEVRTFPNACEARAADYRIIGDGPC
ncbi:MAG: peptidase, partial [Mesorhizobium sp.]